MNKKMKPITAIGVCATVLLMLTQPISAVTIPNPTLKHEVVAEAAPDECFNGVGQPYQPGTAGCEAPDKAKVNQAYVWGMTKTDTHVWFGTAANVLCMVNGTFHGVTSSMENDSWVCEQRESQYPDFLADVTGNDTFRNLKNMGLGDWRTAKIYRYNPETGETDDMTPAPNTYAGQLILTTIGLRSAGTQDGVVFLAGPGFTPSGTVVNMFAFDAESGVLLGAHTYQEYKNIRKWISAEGKLYTAVGVNDIYSNNLNGGTRYSGRVLKWTGDHAHLFNFVEVGLLPGEGAELAHHEGRLFVTTWPDLASSSAEAGVYMGPLLSEERRFINNSSPEATPWKEIWNASDYEPDPVVAKTYGGGAIASFDGKLYWGTMHVPGVSLMAAVSAYHLDPNDKELMEDAAISTNRAISIFRASSITDDGNANVELLYGDSMLKRYMPGSTGGTFVSVPNKMTGNDGLWGKSGFGNMFNNYTWTMNVFKNKLYIGTMDWSYLAIKLANDLGALIPGNPETKVVNPDLPGIDLPNLDLPGLDLPGFSAGISGVLAKELLTASPGADLWRIESGNGNGAIAENITGVGNYGSYGIRTMVSDANSLYLGMANPMNLMTAGIKPKGGWKLIEMKDGFTLPEIPKLPIVPVVVPTSTHSGNNGAGGTGSATTLTVNNGVGDTGSTTTLSSGGGCTYNPYSQDNNKIDLTFLLLFAMALVYPWRRKLVK